MDGSTNGPGDQTGNVDEVALIEGAASGDTAAFDALFRYLGPSTWNYASGVTGDEDIAAAAVIEGFASAVTAVRSGRVDTASNFRRTLFAATRNHIVDAEGATAHNRGDGSLATAFGTLPEKLRSTLWLSAVHRLGPAEVGEVVGGDAVEITKLERRARNGLVNGFVRAEAKAEPRPLCRPSIDRLRKDVLRNLPATERAHLQRHLRVCAECKALHASALNITGRLPALALPFPESLLERAGPAFAAAVAPPPRGTGLSPRTEKVVAGLSAAVAAIGIVGASFLGTDSPKAQSSIAIGPVVGLVGGPQPTELPEVEYHEPESDSPDVGADTRRNGNSSGSGSGSGSTSSPSSSSNDVTVASSSGTRNVVGSPNIGTSDSTTKPPSNDDGDDGVEPPVSPPAEPREPLLKAGVKGLIEVDIGEEPNVSVGDDASDTGVESGGPLDVLDPVVEVVDSTVNKLLG